VTHEGYTFRDAFGKCVTATPSCESASHQMIHWLLEAGFAFSFPLADAAGELKSPGSRVSRRAQITRVPRFETRPERPPAASPLRSQQLHSSTLPVKNKQHHHLQ
jgi:hypothetical protein